MKELLSVSGLNVEELALAVGYSKSYVYKVLNGKGSKKAAKAVKDYLEEIALLTEDSPSKEIESIKPKESVMASSGFDILYKTILSSPLSTEEFEKQKAELIESAYAFYGISEDPESDCTLPDLYDKIMEECPNSACDLYGRPIIINDPSTFRNRGYRLRTSDDYVERPKTSSPINDIGYIGQGVETSTSMTKLGNAYLDVTADDEEYNILSELPFERVYRLKVKLIQTGDFNQYRNYYYEQGMRPDQIRGFDPETGFDYGYVTPKEYEKLIAREDYSTKLYVDEMIARTEAKNEELEARMETIANFVERIKRRVKDFSPELRKLLIVGKSRGFQRLLGSHLYSKHETHWPAPAIKIMEYVDGNQVSCTKYNWILLRDFYRQIEEELSMKEEFIQHCRTIARAKFEGKRLKDVRESIFKRGFDFVCEQVKVFYGRDFAFSTKEQNSEMCKAALKGLWEEYHAYKKDVVAGIEGPMEDAFAKISEAVKNTPLRSLHEVDMSVKDIDLALRYASLKNKPFDRMVWIRLNEIKRDIKEDEIA